MTRTNKQVITFLKNTYNKYNDTEAFHDKIVNYWIKYELTSEQHRLVNDVHNKKTGPSALECCVCEGQITDEQMKALVKLARLPQDICDNYEQLFDNYNQELLVQICYNMNKDLDKCYDTTQYPKVYTARTKVLELLDRWLKSDKDTRLSMTDKLRTAADAASSAAYAAADDAAYAAADDASSAAYAAADDAAYAAYYASRIQPNTKEIVIKTILDYYGEDFETFKVLYL